MMYPFMQMEDGTEIVHSDIITDRGTEHVKVYIERPVYGGFSSATCYLPEYEWESITGFTNEDIERFREILESAAHLIIRFSKDGGFENASNF